MEENEAETVYEHLKDTFRPTSEMIATGTLKIIDKFLVNLENHLEEKGEPEKIWPKNLLGRTVSTLVAESLMEQMDRRFPLPESFREGEKESCAEK